MSVNSKMAAIADAIRSKTGQSGALTLDQMAAAISGLVVGSISGGKTITNITATLVGTSGGKLGDINLDGTITMSDVFALTYDPTAEPNITAEVMHQLIVNGIASGQGIVRIDITYSDNTSETRFVVSDLPEASESGSGGGDSESGAGEVTFASDEYELILSHELGDALSQVKVMIDPSSIDTTQIFSYVIAILYIPLGSDNVSIVIYNNYDFIEVVSSLVSGNEYVTADSDNVYIMLPSTTIFPAGLTYKWEVS